MITDQKPTTRYKGKICEKHPDEDGLRYTCSCRCVVCVAVARYEWAQVPNNKKNLSKASSRYAKKNRAKINARASIARKMRIAREIAEREVEASGKSPDVLA